MIVAGGTGPNDYVLQRGSTMIGAGTDYRPLVSSPPAVDYFGNSIRALTVGADAVMHVSWQEAPVPRAQSSGQAGLYPGPTAIVKPRAQRDDQPASDREPAVTSPCDRRSMTEVPGHRPMFLSPFPFKLDLALQRAWLRSEAMARQTAP
jgi:hypothetical protein